ncbi:MAG: hypothetical protein H0T51_11005 [Pirellulales bacterium]|nr:hypothetical protein [Pirellulales bacterium]
MRSTMAGLAALAFAASGISSPLSVTECSFAREIRDQTHCCCGDNCQCGPSCGEKSPAEHDEQGLPSVAKEFRDPVNISTWVAPPSDFAETHRAVRAEVVVLKAGQPHTLVDLHTLLLV